MEVWSWLVLAVLGLTLVRLFATVANGEGERLTVAGDSVAAPPGPPVVPAAAGECPHCGAENDPAYTYCRNCTRQL
jgi:hypothetical protein